WCGAIGHGESVGRRHRADIGLLFPHDRSSPFSSTTRWLCGGSGVRRRERQLVATLACVLKIAASSSNARKASCNASDTSSSAGSGGGARSSAEGYSSRISSAPPL